MLYNVYENGSKLVKRSNSLNDARKYSMNQVIGKNRTHYWICRVRKNNKLPLVPVGDVYYPGFKGHEVLYLNWGTKKNYAIRKDGSLGKEY